MKKDLFIIHNWLRWKSLTPEGVLIMNYES